MCYRKDRIEAENQEHLDLDLDLMPFKDLMRTSYQDLVRMGSGCWQDAGSGAGPVAALNRTWTWRANLVRSPNSDTYALSSTRLALTDAEKTD